MNPADWMNLVRQKAWSALDDRWMAAVEDPDTDHSPMLGVLDALAKAGEGQRAAAMAWMWLTALRERCRPEEVIRLAKEMIINSSGSDQLRVEVAELYKQAYAGRPGIDSLIEASGLLGGKTPRRALRILDLGLHAVPGAYVLSRSDDRPAEVIQADLSGPRFVLRTRSGTVEVDADELAAGYNPADANDFRVLSELHPERFASLLEDDPARLIIGIIQMHGGRIDAEELKYFLTPAHLSGEDWPKWWSKARTALKRHPNVRLEGRSPLVLTYDEAGCSLEDEVRAQWSRARTAEERIATIDAYLREAKSRKTPVNAAILNEWGRSLKEKIAAHRDHPTEAMRIALVVERLRIAGYGDLDGPSPVATVLADAPDPIAVMREFASSSLFDLMLAPAKVGLGDRWADVFLHLLPCSPPDVCDALAAHLLDAGLRDRVQAVIRQIPTQPLENLRGITWLWRGPARAEGLELPPRVELFGRMMTLLGDLARRDDTPPAVLKEVRASVRAALVTRKLGAFREMLAGAEPGMVQAIHRQVARTPGLSSALVHDLKAIIHELFPTLFEKTRLEPHEDPDAIYTTEAGRAKAEAELNYIVNVKMPENARAIGAAAAHGDLSENSEYKFALEERDLLRARVAKIQNDLARARVIEPHLVPRDRVGVGSRVKVRSLDGSLEQEMVFLGPWDADVDRHIYNYNAPMSQRMMGLRVGDTVQLNLDGTDREFSIVAIETAV